MDKCCDEGRTGFPKRLLLLGLGIVVLKVLRKKRMTGRTPGVVWERMRRRMEEMPEDFPPRVLYDTVMAIREDTTKILERLEGSAE